MANEGIYMLVDDRNLDLDLKFREIVFKNDLKEKLINFFNILFEKFIKPIGVKVASTEFNSKTFPTEPIETYETNILKANYEKENIELLYYLIGSIVLDKDSEFFDKNVANGKSVSERVERKAKLMKKRAAKFNKKFNQADIITLRWRPITDGFMNVSIIFDKYNVVENNDSIEKISGEEKQEVVQLDKYKKEKRAREFKVIKERIRIEALENGITISEDKVGYLAELRAG